MIVHLYAHCWNDAWFLPFFFRHYDPIVDRYFIFDDGSTDATRNILEAHPRVTVGRFERTVPDSFTLSGLEFSNNCWKASRDVADWIILTDVDEHLYHARGRDYLAQSLDRGVTMIPALGFIMIENEPPPPTALLCRDHLAGVFDQGSLKPSVFAPRAIEEMDFDPGRHRARPKGRVRVPDVDELVLLHYRYMGFEQTHERHLTMRQGLAERDVRTGWCHKYSWTREQFRDDWNDTCRRAFDLRPILDDASAHYPGARWWEGYRIPAVSEG